MNKITCGVFLLFVFVYFAALVIHKAWKAEREKNAVLVKELEKQKQNMARMIELTKRLMQVHDSKEQVADKIRNAKNEEEVINALNALIAANNARVSDNGKSCACAAGKAKAGSAPADS